MIRRFRITWHCSRADHVSYSWKSGYEGYWGWNQEQAFSTMKSFPVWSPWSRDWNEKLDMSCFLEAVTYR